jgi:hypothetical protein
MWPDSCRPPSRPPARPYIPPTGSVFAAWEAPAAVEPWLAGAPEAARARLREALAVVRSRGYQLGLINDAQRVFATTLGRLAESSAGPPDVDLREMVQQLDYDPLELSAAVLRQVRLISVPVFGPRGEVVLALTIYEFPKPAAGSGVLGYIDRALEAAQHVSERIAGTRPA